MEDQVNIRFPGKTIGEFFIEIVKVVIISLAIIIPVRYFLIQPFMLKVLPWNPVFMIMNI